MIILITDLFSSLFRSTDTVPSDYMAGFILMRVRQKRETRELRRLQLLDEQQPIYTLGMMQNNIPFLCKYNVPSNLI